MRAVERGERRHQRRQRLRLGDLGHLAHHGDQAARPTADRALPEPSPGPCLEHGEPEEQPAGRPQDPAAEPRARPGGVGQRHEHTCDDIEQHRAGSAEQQREPGSEDPAEGAAERPHHEPPSGRDQSGTLAPLPTGCHQQQQSDADLDPHRRRSGDRRVICPDGDPRIDQVAHPLRRRCRRRLDDCGRKTARHAGLQLQQPVEEPEEAERDPEKPPGRWLQRDIA